MLVCVGLCSGLWWFVVFSATPLNICMKEFGSEKINFHKMTAVRI